MSEEKKASGLAPVGDVLDEVLGRFAGPTQAAGLVIFDRWDVVAGPPWEGARPVKIDDLGTLVVEVPDGGTATRLRYQTDGLVSRIEAEVGAGVVSGIRLRVARGGR